MRVLLLWLLLAPNLVLGASAQGSIDSLSAMVSTLWQTHSSACVMALEPEVQRGSAARVQFLDEQMVGRYLEVSLQSQANDRRSQWRSNTWSQRENFENSALKPINREYLREYYFKLQAHTPDAQRAKRLADIQYMSQTLNFALRRGIWKTCHGLGLANIPLAQFETAVEKRWQRQAKKVKSQLEKELAAFYFYSFRKVEQAQLNTFADVAQGLKPWVDNTATAIDAHFAELRAQLLQMPLVIEAPINAPSLEDRPWPPSPSLGLPAP